MHNIGIRSGVFLLWLLAAFSAKGELVEVGADEAMTHALAQCELAQEARLAKRPDEAKEHINAFEMYRDKALSSAPTSDEGKETSSSLRSCERLASIVARSFEQWQQQQTSIARVVDESSLYVRECKQSLEMLEGANSDATLSAAEKALGRASTHKENVKGEWQAFAAFREDLEHPSKFLLAEQMAEGDACLAKVNALISQKQDQAARVARLLKPYENRLNNGARSCEAVKRAAGSRASPANLADAKRLLESVRSDVNAVAADYRRDNTLSSYDEWSQVTDFNQELAALNACVASAENAVAVMSRTVREQQEKLAKAEAARLAREREEAQRQEEARRKAAAQAASPAPREAAKPSGPMPVAESGPATANSANVESGSDSSARAGSGLGSVADRIEKARQLAAEAARAEAAAEAARAAGPARPESLAERVERARMLAAEAAKAKAAEETPAKTGSSILESLRR